MCNTAGCDKPADPELLYLCAECLELLVFDQEFDDWAQI
jgi:hypothetical protein